MTTVAYHRVAFPACDCLMSFSPLSELEYYVERLQRSSTSTPGQLSITLRDVEEGAINLRRVGEALAILKGQWILGCIKTGLH